MKSEKEFLDGVWDKISEIEFYEIEKEKIFIYNKKLRRKDLYIKCLISVSIIFFLSILVIFAKNINLTLLGGLIAILLPTFYELNHDESKWLNNNEGVVDFGNNNKKSFERF